jgi:hypothetical protein
MCAHVRTIHTHTNTHTAHTQMDAQKLERAYDLYEKQKQHTPRRPALRTPWSDLRKLSSRDAAQLIREDMGYSDWSKHMKDSEERRKKPAGVSWREKLEDESPDKVACYFGVENGGSYARDVAGVGEKMAGGGSDHDGHGHVHAGDQDQDRPREGSARYEAGVHDIHISPGQNSNGQNLNGQNLNGQNSNGQSSSSGGHAPRHHAPAELAPSGAQKASPSPRSMYAYKNSDTDRHLIPTNELRKVSMMQNEGIRSSNIRKNLNEHMRSDMDTRAENMHTHTERYMRGSDGDVGKRGATARDGNVDIRRQTDANGWPLRDGKKSDNTHDKRRQTGANGSLLTDANTAQWKSHYTTKDQYRSTDMYGAERGDVDARHYSRGGGGSLTRVPAQSSVSASPSRGNSPEKRLNEAGYMRSMRFKSASDAETDHISKRDALGSLLRAATTTATTMQQHHSYDDDLSSVNNSSVILSSGDRVHDDGRFQRRLYSSAPSERSNVWRWWVEDTEEETQNADSMFRIRTSLGSADGGPYTDHNHNNNNSYYDISNGQARYADTQQPRHTHMEASLRGTPGNRQSPHADTQQPRHHPDMEASLRGTPVGALINACASYAQMSVKKSPTEVVGRGAEQAKKLAEAMMDVTRMRDEHKRRDADVMRERTLLHVSNDSSFVDHDTSYVSVGSRAGSLASSPSKSAYMYGTLTKGDFPRVDERRDSLSRTQTQTQTQTTRGVYDPVDSSIHRFIEKTSDLMQPKIRDFSMDMYSLGAEFLDKEWCQRSGLYSTRSDIVKMESGWDGDRRSSGGGHGARKRGVSDEKLDMIEERLRLLEKSGV